MLKDSNLYRDLAHAHVQNSGRRETSEARGEGNLYFIKITLFARMNERQTVSWRGGGRPRARIHINPLCRGITLRRKDDSIYARNRLGPRVNAMISLTGYAYLRKSISAGKPGTSSAVGRTRRGLAPSVKRDGWN